MNSTFIAILQKLTAEQRREILLDAARCRSFLTDCFPGEYIKESRLFLLAIEAGIARAVDETKDLELCKKQQIRLLYNEYFILPQFAGDVVNALILLLKDNIKGVKPGSDFVFIKGGSFMMGSPKDDESGSGNDRPQHQVVINDFYMGKYQVKQKEWTAVMGSNPSFFKGYKLPVETVNWYDAIEYCNKRSIIEGLAPVYMINKDWIDPNNRDNDKIQWLVIWNEYANGYRLPTEAEWEYACRAGTTTPFNTGINIDTGLANYNGWDEKIIKGIFREKTTEAGSFKPNSWGLHDMHGNVWEWCWDWHGDYTKDTQENPKGAFLGSWRVIRGGSWASDTYELRSACRWGDTSPGYPSKKNEFIGFRLAR